MQAQTEYTPIPSHRALVPVAPKRGRPAIYDVAVMQEVLDRLADGESLRKICRDAHMPSEALVRKRARVPGSWFSAQYALAREIGYEGLADELLELSDSKLDDPARSRLQVDTRKWLLSKCLPKVFGDKLLHDHSGTVTVKHENMLDRVAQLEIEGKL